MGQAHAKTDSTAWYKFEEIFCLADDALGWLGRGYTT